MRSIAAQFLPTAVVFDSILGKRSLIKNLRARTTYISCIFFVALALGCCIAAQTIFYIFVVIRSSKVSEVSLPLK